MVVKKWAKYLFILCLVLVSGLIYYSNPMDLRDFWKFIEFAIQSFIVTSALFLICVLLIILLEIVGGYWDLNKMKNHCDFLIPFEKKRLSVLGMKGLLLVGSLLGIVIIMLELLPYSRIILIGLIYVVLHTYQILLLKERMVSVWFKESLVSKALELHFEQVSYQADDFMLAYELQSLDLFYDDITGNDLVKAYRKTRQFQSSDVIMRKRVDKVNRRGQDYSSYETIFRGTVIRLSMEQYTEKLLVVSKGFKNAKQVLTKFEKYIGYEMDGFLETESYKFNSYFDVYTSKKIASQKVLLPATIQAMVEVVENINRQMLFLYSGTFLYVFIDTKGQDPLEMNVMGQGSLELQYDVALEHVEKMAFIIDKLGIRRE